MTQTVVVVGASLAGLRAAETLRTSGFEGDIVLVGAEHHLPYDRPPLSKKLLSGEWEADRIVLRKPEAYGELRLDMRLGTQATDLDLVARTVTLNDGTPNSSETQAFDGLIIATGAACRRLPNQPDLANVFTLRTLDDALQMRAALQTGSPRVAVIGAGFIGAEVAATARHFGCDVTIIEALPVPLVRALGPSMGAACAEIHRDHDVTVRLGVGVDRLEGSQRVEGVRLADGTLIEADVVIVGIGVVPVTDWFAHSGLQIRDGVVCDEFLSCGAPGVYAAGDLVRWPNALFAEEMRVEHWSNAAEQGAIAAHNLVAELQGSERKPYAPVPFFWSDQYDRRIQFLGRASTEDEVEIVGGSIEERSFVALYHRDGRMRGVLGMNQPRAVMGYRKLLEAGTSIDDARAHARR
jgi:NADPH-dependent 2,4-dienoyl-CoA reductase/sulfur reductase-like enzyme